MGDLSAGPGLRKEEGDNSTARLFLAITAGPLEVLRDVKDHRSEIAFVELFPGWIRFGLYL